MSSPTAFTAFQTALAAFTALPVVFENERFEPTEPFVYVEVYGDSFDQTTTGAPGANLWTETGTTFIHVLIESFTGTSAARTYASAIMDLFREQPVGDLTITEMNIGSGDPGKDFPGFWAMTLTIFWTRREFTSAP